MVKLVLAFVLGVVVASVVIYSLFYKMLMRLVKEWVYYNKEVKDKLSSSFEEVQRKLDAIEALVEPPEV